MADYATRERIFEAIEQTIIELGIEAVTFAEIAARVHMQPSSLTYYFPQKDDMLTEFFNWWLTAQREPLPASSAQTPEQAVRELCGYIDNIIKETPFENPVIRAIVRSSLVGAERDDRYYRLAGEIMRNGVQNVQDAFAQLLPFGIFDTQRYQFAVIEFSNVILGHQVMGFFDIELPCQQEVMQAAAERVKRTILKDGLYPPKK